MEYILIIFVVVLVISVFLIILFTILSETKKQNKDSNNVIEDFADNYYLDAIEYGEAGEHYVSSYLKEILKEYGGYLFNSFRFEFANGKSNEIDHILITRGGVFVIETKSMKGKIYGEITDKDWECAKEEYESYKYFRNPIKQNNAHIYHLRNMFSKNPPKMISIIIFPVADLSEIDAENVYYLDEAIDYIRTKTIKKEYSPEYVKKVHDELLKIKQFYSITKEEHINNCQQFN